MPDELKRAAIQSVAAKNASVMGNEPSLEVICMAYVVRAVRASKHVDEEQSGISTTPNSFDLLLHAAALPIPLILSLSKDERRGPQLPSIRLPQPARGLLRVVRDDDVRARAADRGQRFEDGRAFVQPALRGRRLHHRVLP